MNTYNKLGETAIFQKGSIDTTLKKITSQCLLPLKCTQDTINMTVSRNLFTESSFLTYRIDIRNSMKQEVKESILYSMKIT